MSRLTLARSASCVYHSYSLLAQNNRGYYITKSEFFQYPRTILSNFLHGTSIHVFAPKPLHDNLDFEDKITVGSQPYRAEKPSHLIETARLKTHSLLEAETPITELAAPLLQSNGHIRSVYPMPLPDFALSRVFLPFLLYTSLGNSILFGKRMAT
jgi:hypothetical protein